MSVARRSFLLSAAAAAGAAGAAEKPVRVAVYGVGHAHARGKLRTLAAMPQFDLVGVCEPRLAQPLDGLDLAGLPRLSPPQMLADSSIELIAVEARVQENLRYAHEAIDAGKFVHLDKPPGEDLDSLRSLFDKAAAKQLVVQMGYQWRYHIAMSEAIRLARQGALGSVYMLRATINKPISPGERRELARFQGGMMFELGCHMIDRVVDLLGPPRQVSGWLRHHGPLDDGLADNTLAVLDFDGAMAEVYIAAMQPNGNSYRTFEILGTRGTATVTPFSPDGGLYTDFANKTGPYPPGRHPVPLSIPRWKGPYEPDFAEMFGIIRRGEKPRYTREHDLAVQKALLEACRLPAKNRGLNFIPETPR